MEQIDPEIAAWAASHASLLAGEYEFSWPHNAKQIVMPSQTADMPPDSLVGIDRAAPWIN